MIRAAVWQRKNWSYLRVSEFFQCVSLWLKYCESSPEQYPAREFRWKWHRDGILQWCKSKKLYSAWIQLFQCNFYQSASVVISYYLSIAAPESQTKPVFAQIKRFHWPLLELRRRKSSWIRGLHSSPNFPDFVILRAVLFPGVNTMNQGNIYIFVLLRPWSGATDINWYSTEMLEGS